VRVEGICRGLFRALPLIDIYLLVVDFRHSRGGILSSKKSESV
jgi:hypothetical protein